MLHTLKNWLNSTKVIDADKPLPLGHELLGYSIDRVIHKGGMSWVYKAWDPKSKPVIIKEFFPHSSAKRAGFQVESREGRDLFFREAMRRFHEEGRYMGLFRGANFGRIRSFFTHNGTAYMVLEWERGRTFAAYTKVKRTSWANWNQAKPFVNDIRLALNRMHQSNILHLDLHPANIFLTLHGRGVLLDFGAARHIAEPVLNSARFYTPGYSAPEIQNNSPWGPWTDIYSFGSCLRALGALRPEQEFPQEVSDMTRGCLVENIHERIRSLQDPRVLAVFE